jgi:predicted DNA-binding transcriptional regulator AlpA
MNIARQLYPVQPASGFLRISQILALVPIGKSTWWRWVAEGKAPKPLKLGAKTTVWDAEEIAAFLEKMRREGGSHA